MASNRHLGRIVVLQTLYEYEFRLQAQDKTVDLSEIIFRNMKQYDEVIGDKQFVQDLLNGIIEKQVELDTKLQPMAPEWPISEIQFRQKLQSMRLLNLRKRLVPIIQVSL